MRRKLTRFCFIITSCFLVAGCGSTSITPQGICTTECYYDCKINTCDSDSSNMVREYNDCKRRCGSNQECKIACATARNENQKVCAEGCMDMCKEESAVAACEDGVWDNWNGGIRVEPL